MVRLRGKQVSNAEQGLDDCTRVPVSTPRLHLLSLAKI
jgi:hypothetical protein